MTLDLHAEFSGTVPYGHGRLLIRPTGRQIIADVAARHGLTPADLTGRCRRRAIAWPRQEAMYEMRQLTKLSTPQIGGLLGGRDHATILHGIKKHAERLVAQ